MIYGRATYLETRVSSRVIHVLPIKVNSPIDDLRAWPLRHNDD